MRIRGLLLMLVVECGVVPSTPDGGVDAAPPPLPPVSLAEGLALSEIAFYETVKIPVVTDGVEVSRYNAPLITARKGIARVFMKLANKRYKPRSLNAALHISSASEVVLTDTKTIRGSPSEEDLSTTFTFSYDDRTLDIGASYWLEVTDPAARDAGGRIRYPESPALLDVTKSPGRLRLRFVPVRYQADGSGRMPDTSASQIEIVRAWMFDLYPTSEVDIDVRQTVLDWSTPVVASGSGWPELLQAILDARAQDAPPNDIYYIGAFEPKPTFGQYCQTGCVAGLASTAAPAIPSERAVLVLGYGGAYMGDTISHELGHVMGRFHAPCGSAQGVDPKFPYPDGSIGVPGWRESDQTLFPYGSDFMSYCQPYWTSDYTYKALAARIRFVNAQGFGSSAPRDVQRILVRPNGALSPGGTLRMSEVIGGNDVTVVYYDETNTVVAKVPGHAYGYDHAPGGFVLAPDPPAVWSTAEIPALAKIRLQR